MGGLSTVKHKTAIWDAITVAERNSASAPESCALKFLFVSDPLKSGPSISVQPTLMVTAFWDSLEMERISMCRPVDAEINIQFNGARSWVSVTSRIVHIK